MNREKMELARGLIQQKHYNEARSVLQTLDDPRAREWLTKLDKMRPQPPPQKTVSRRLLIAVILSFVSVLIAIIVLIFVLSYQSSVKKTNELLTLYCMEVELLNL